MQELRPTFENIQIPSSDCNQEPSADPSTPDNCHVILELSDGSDTRALRFDRNGDRFALSVRPSGAAGEILNSQENINWFIQHALASARVLQTMRIFGATLPTSGVRKPTPEARAAKAVFPLIIAHYIVTGRAQFPSQAEGEEPDLAGVLLDVLATSDPKSVSEFVGKIAVFQGAAELSESARQRAAWVVSLLKLVPKYQELMSTLVPPALDRKIDWEKESNRDHYAVLQRFIANLVVDLGRAAPIRFDAQTWQAFAAYAAIHGGKNADAQFCGDLIKGIRKLSAKPVNEADFLQSCREGIRLSRIPAERAALESIPVYLKSADGRRAIEREMKTEIRRSRMTADWLQRRGQIARIAALLSRHSRIEVEGKDEAKRASLKVDAEALQRDLTLLIREEAKTKHREPVIAALGSLRVLFGKQAEQGKVLVFWEGEFSEIPLKYSRPAMRKTIGMLEEDLRKSFFKSEVAWPIGQASVGALGATSLGLGLGLRSAPRAARQGLFIGGCTAIGMSLGSLVQHAKRARNKHIWGAVGAAVGGAVFGGVCAAVATQTSLFKREGGAMNMPMPDPGERNPVDEHGP